MKIRYSDPVGREGRRLGIIFRCPSSPHPAVALSDACGTPAQGPQGGQWWGEAVPAAGREQGAGLGAALARRTGAARL